MNANALPGSARNSTHLARTATAVMALALVFSLAIVATPAARAQTYTVIHDFTCGGDGGYPNAGLTMDAAGNLYGATSGSLSPISYYGTVFRLLHSGSGWVLTTLYSFAGGSDGAGPLSRVALAQDGTLYGTTSQGGILGGRCDDTGCGTVFHLTPPPVAPRAALAPLNETVIHRFTGGSDGGAPAGDLTFDPSGNIYGTASIGGANGGGVIYQLTPSGGIWTETVLYTPYSGDAIFPAGGVVFDASGNLYGVFDRGGPYDDGAVYELSPSGSGWTEQILHNFSGSDGRGPTGGLIFDESGDLYGTTELGGTGGNSGSGTVFELTPLNDGWIFNMLYSFPGYLTRGPVDKLVMDAAGNLYGMTNAGGPGGIGAGSVFKLTRSSGGWAYTLLHEFSEGSDGGYPYDGVIMDTRGNLYGTAALGGAYGCGVAFQITP